MGQTASKKRTQCASRKALASTHRSDEKAAEQAAEHKAAQSMALGSMRLRGETNGSKN